MAGVQATIDLIVRGSNAVNKLIEDVNQLDGAVRRINSRTLDVASGTFSRKASEIQSRLEKVSRTSGESITRQLDEAVKNATRAEEKLFSLQKRQSESAARSARTGRSRDKEAIDAEAAAIKELENNLSKSKKAVGSLQAAFGALTRDIEDPKKQIAAIERALNRVKAVGKDSIPVAEIGRQLDRLAKQQEAVNRQIQASEEKLAKTRESIFNRAAQLQERAQNPRNNPQSQAQTSMVSAQKQAEKTVQSTIANLSSLTGKLRNIYAEITVLSNRGVLAEIPDLINLNKVKATQQALRVLSEEFNRLGDSAQPAAEEISLSQTFLPKSISQYTALSKQLQETQARYKALRAEIAQGGRIGRNLTVRSAVNLNMTGIGQESQEDQVEKMGRLLEYMKSGDSRSNIESKNKEKSQRRKEIVAELRMLEAEMNRLEAGAARAGQEVLGLQERLSNLVEARQSTEPARGLNISLNQLQAQAETLALVANNSSLASRSFKDFTVAAQVASLALGRGQQQTFTALAKGFSSYGAGNELPIQRERLAGARGMVAKLVADTEALIKSSLKSEAAFSAHIAQLTQIRSILPFLSDEYRAVEDSIAKLNEELKDVGLRGQTSKRRTHESEDRFTVARGKALRQQLALEDLIVQSSLKEVEKKLYLKQLEKAVEQVSQGRYHLAKDTVDALNQQVKAAIKLQQLQGKNQGSAIGPTSRINDLAKQLKYAQEVRNIEKDSINAQNAAANLQGILTRLKSDGIPVDQVEVGLQKAIKNYSDDLLKAEEKKISIGKDQVKNYLEQITALQRLTQLTVKRTAAEKEIERLTKVVKEDRSVIGSPESKRNELTRKLQMAQDALNKGDLDYAVRQTKEVDRQLAAQGKLYNSIIASGKAQRDQLATLSEISNRYQILEKQGVTFGSERGRLQGLKKMLESGRIQATPENVSAVDQVIKRLTGFERSRKSEAILAGTFTGAGKVKTLEDPVAIQAKQLGFLLDLQRKYSIEKAKGVELTSQEVRLNEQIRKIRDGETAATAKNLAMTGADIKIFRNELARQVTAAKAAGTYQYGVKSTETVEARSKRVETLAFGALAEVAALEKRGLDTAGQRLIIEEAIVDLERVKQNIKDQNITNAMDELDVIRQQASAVRQMNKDLESRSKAGLIQGAGLRAGLKAITDAKSASKDFLGDLSPEQAIDKVVRAFNDGKTESSNAGANIADTFSSKLKSKAGKAFEAAKVFATAATKAILKTFKMASPSRFMIEVVRNLTETFITEMEKAIPNIRFASSRVYENSIDSISEVTTRPNVYRNLLKALPPSALTSDIFEAAITRRSRALENPGFMGIQRTLGPGNLEKAIAKAYASYLKSTRDPWAGKPMQQGVSQLQELLQLTPPTSKPATKLLPPSRPVAGLLPSSGASDLYALNERITSRALRRLLALERSRQNNLAISPPIFSPRQVFPSVDQPSQDVSGSASKFPPGLQLGPGGMAMGGAKLPTGLKLGATNPLQVSGMTLPGIAGKIGEAVLEVFKPTFKPQFGLKIASDLAEVIIKGLERSYPRIKSITEKTYGTLQPVGPSSAQYRPIQRIDRSTGEGMYTNVLSDRLINSIVKVTTQPKIYENLLRGLPISTVAGDIATAARDRAAIVSENPRFMQAQRMLGPGSLEKVIAKAFANYLKSTRAPDPWVGESVQQQISQPARPALKPVNMLSPSLDPYALLELSRLHAQGRLHQRNLPIPGIASSIELLRTLPASTKSAPPPAPLSQSARRSGTGAGTGPMPPSPSTSRIDPSQTLKPFDLFRSTIKEAFTISKTITPMLELLKSKGQDISKTTTAIEATISKIKEISKATGSANVDAQTQKIKELVKILQKLGGGSRFRINKLFGTKINTLDDVVRLAGQTPDPSQGGSDIDLAGKWLDMSGSEIPGPSIDDLLFGPNQIGSGRTKAKRKRKRGRRGAGRGAGGGAGGGGGSGAGAAGGMGDNLDDAARKAAQELLGLKSLKAPSKAAISELQALANTLEGVRATLDPLKPGTKKLDRELRNATARIQRNLASRDSGADSLTRFTRDPRTANAISEGLIGGIFPLLFGQGAGASVFGGLGGAAGGFLGGGLGFGLSLAGTAIGTMFDQLNQAAQDTGKALNYPIEGFEKLKEAGLFSSRAQEFYISKLIETGQVGRAQAEIQAQIISKIGVSGTNDLMRLGSASTRLGKAFGEASLQLQALLAGPMADLLGWVASATEIINKVLGNEKVREAIRITALKVTTTAVPGTGLLAAGYDIYSKINSKPEKPIKPKEDLAQQQQAVQAQRQAADELKGAYREGFQLQQQIIDLERKQIDIRRRIENEIFQKQQDNLRLQIDNERKRAQISIDTVDLEYRRRISKEEGRAAQVLAAEAELVKTRAQGEANMAAARKTLELDIERQKRETENYIYNLQREAESIRRETLGLEMQVLDHRERLERIIQDRRMTEIAQQQAALTGGAAGAAGAAGGAAAGAAGAAGGRGARPLVIEGAFDTGLRTGPSHLIGGSTEYHQHTDFGRGVTPERQRQLMLSLARAYDKIGRYIVLSNQGIHGNRFPLDGGIVAQNKWITDALNAHQRRNGGTGSRAIDFFAPMKGQTPSGPSVVGQAILAPMIPGGSVRYNEERRGAGRYISIFDPSGKLVQRFLHGAMVGPIPRNRTLPPAQGAVAPGAPLSGDSTTRQYQGLVEQGQELQERLRGGVGIPAGAGAAMQRLNEQDARIRREQLRIQKAEQDLNEQRAIQQLQEAARGPIEIRQTRERLNQVRANSKIFGPMSDVRRDFGLFLEGQRQSILNKIEESKDILSKITPANREIVQQAQDQAMRNLRERLALERQIEIIQRSSQILTSASQQTYELNKENEARELRNHLLAQGIAPEIIDGEVRALRIREHMNVVMNAYNLELRELLRTTKEVTNLDNLPAETVLTTAQQMLGRLKGNAALTPEQKEFRDKLDSLLTDRSTTETQTTTAIQQAREAARRSAKEPMTPAQEKQKQISDLKKELKNLLNPAKQLIGAADAISNSFSESFQSIITGSTSAQEALANFFQKIASHFIDMAAKIAANNINQAILGLFNFPGLSLTSSSASVGKAGLGGLGASALVKPFANGGAFTNSVVNSPTLFKFADGGTMESGVMGEAGPEAVMPLKRGPGGRLGISAFVTGQDSDEDTYRESFEENRQALAAAQEARMKRQVEQTLSSGASSTEIKYNRVGSGDLPFVTEETMLEATRLAAEQGAKIGQRRTLAALRNDPSARRSAGIR